MSNSAVAEKVRLFKNLSRPQTVPSGLPNHWIFRVRHVPLNPPGDLVVAVHPQSHFQLQAGPAQILSLPTTLERAEALLPHLLQAFIKGGDPEQSSWAPWSWASDDQEMASALEVKLREYGVPDELCTVGVCNAEEKAVMDEAWSGLVGTLMKFMGRDAKTKKANATAQQQVQPGDDSKCHDCKTPSTALAQALKRCGACAMAWYCSQDCQKKHWKTHKPTCLANRPGGTSSAAASSSSGTKSIQDIVSYFVSIAHTKPEARALAKSVNLTLPTSMETFEGTAKPVRRLVVTGKDTPENLELFFGPDWQQFLQKDVEDARLEVLLSPPRGSPSYTKNAEYDNGAPSWAPRSASESERQKVAEVREMQDRIRQKVGSGRSPSNADMKEMLSSFGAAWVEKAAVYMLALNTMDQGVEPL